MSLSSFFEYFEPSEDLIRPVPTEDASFPEVDYRKNPTPLFKAIESKSWASAKHFLLTGYWHGALAADAAPPAAQVCTWVTKYEPNGDGGERGVWTQLPIHAAIIYGAPEAVIKLLAKTCPATLRCADDQRMLPLHLAFRHGCSDSIVGLILDMFPEGLNVNDFKGRSPVECAMEGPGSPRGEIIRKIFQKNDTQWLKKQSKLEAKQRKQRELIKETKNSLKSKTNEASHLKVAVDLIKWREDQTKKVLMTVVSELKGINCWYKQQEKIAAKEEIVENLATKLASLQQVAEELVVEAQRQMKDAPDASFVSPEQALFGNLSKLEGSSITESEDYSVTTSSSFSTACEEKVLMNDNIVFLNRTQSRPLTANQASQSRVVARIPLTRDESSQPRQSEGHRSVTNQSDGKPNSQRIVARIPLTRPEEMDEMISSKKAVDNTERKTSTSDDSSFSSSSSSCSSSSANKSLRSRIVARISLTRQEAKNDSPQETTYPEKATTKSEKDDSESLGSKKSEKSKTVAKIPLALRHGSSQSHCNEATKQAENNVLDNMETTAAESVTENAPREGECPKESRASQLETPKEETISAEGSSLPTKASQAQNNEESANASSSKLRHFSCFHLPNLDICRLGCLDECIFGSHPLPRMQSSGNKALPSNSKDIPPGQIYVSTVTSTDSDTVFVGANLSQDSCPDLVSAEEPNPTRAASQDSCPNLIASTSSTDKAEGDCISEQQKAIIVAQNSVDNSCPDLVSVCKEVDDDNELEVDSVSRKSKLEKSVEGTTEECVKTTSFDNEGPTREVQPVYPSTKKSRGFNKKPKSLLNALKNVSARVSTSLKKMKKTDVKSPNDGPEAQSNPAFEDPEKEEGNYAAEEQSLQEVSVKEFKESVSVDVNERQSDEVPNNKDTSQSNNVPTMDISAEDETVESPKESTTMIVVEAKDKKSPKQDTSTVSKSTEEPLARLAKVVLKASNRKIPHDKSDISVEDIDYVLSEKNPEDEARIEKAPSDGVSIEMSEEECEVVKNQTIDETDTSEDAEAREEDQRHSLFVKDQRHPDKKRMPPNKAVFKAAFREASKKATMMGSETTKATPKAKDNESSLAESTYPDSNPASVEESVHRCSSKECEHSVHVEKDHATSSSDWKADAAACKRIFKSFMKQNRSTAGNKVAPE